MVRFNQARAKAQCRSTGDLQPGFMHERCGLLGLSRFFIGHPDHGEFAKVRMAARLRRETAMSLKWIAERLAMGSWTIAGDKVFQGCRMPGFQRQAGGADRDSAGLTD
jgi:hypothetical protein